VIVVGGEALIDLVPTESTVDGELVAMLPRLGGGPFNTAVAAGRLGAQTSFLSRVSTDHFGEAVMERLRVTTVDTSLVQRGHEPSGLAVVGLRVGGSERYTFHIDRTADRGFIDPGALPRHTTTLSLGTLGLVLEPGASAYETVLRREAARGVCTVLDPNIRAELISDPAAYRSRFASWLPDVRVLKVSEEDAAWLLDEPAGDLLARAARWLDAGPEAVVLTRGGAGLAVVTRSGDVIQAPAKDVPVADTVGAGDTVHGALLVRLEQALADIGEDLSALDTGWWESVLRFAAEAAAATVSRVGAEPPWAAELTRM
jgi:fructokinase